MLIKKNIIFIKKIGDFLAILYLSAKYILKINILTLYISK